MPFETAQASLDQKERLKYSRPNDSKIAVSPRHVHLTQDHWISSGLRYESAMSRRCGISALGVIAYAIKN